MNKIRVTHIHIDYKFVIETRVFEGDYFDNTVIIFENGDKYFGPYREKVIIPKISNKGIKKTVDICNHSDLVVLYGLSLINQKIALSVKSNIKIAWRFFGFELYEKMPEFCYSEKTIKILYPNRLQKYLNKIKLINKTNIRSIFLSRVMKAKKGFIKAVKRIDIFLCLSEEEYHLLKHYYPYLPPLVKFPVWMPENSLSTVENNCKLPIVIVGNNRSPLNNHLDIIEMIDNHTNDKGVEFDILFNYGNYNRYTEEVIKATHKADYYKLIEEFMPYEEFQLYYKKVSALVINSYRQMAVGNIFTALQRGVKVYLNKNNVVLNWLRNEKYTLFTMEDFVNDLESGNIMLTHYEMQYNIQNMTRLSKINTIEIFQKQMLECI